MTKKDSLAKVLNGLIEMGENQLSFFKKFQDEEMEGMTVRDFDAWVSGYVSGLSFYYEGLVRPHLVSNEEEFSEGLKKIGSALGYGPVAKSLGVGVPTTEFVQTFNVAKAKKKR
jgi:hypothetical protein